MNNLFQRLLFAHLDGLFSGLSIEAFEIAIKDGKSTVKLLPWLPKYILALADLNKIDYWAEQGINFIKSKYPAHYQVIKENPGWLDRQKKMVREYLT